jgi:hypothetical protein
LVFPDLRRLLQEPLSTQDLLDKKFGGSRTSDDLYYLRKPQFSTIGEYRLATAWINDQIFALRSLQTDKAVVTRFPYEEINSRLHRIAKALAKRVEDLERETIRSTTLLRQLQIPKPSMHSASVSIKSKRRLAVLLQPPAMCGQIGVNENARSKPTSVELGLVLQQRVGRFLAHGKWPIHDNRR